MSQEMTWSQLFVSLFEVGVQKNSTWISENGWTSLVHGPLLLLKPSPHDVILWPSNIPKSARLVKGFDNSQIKV